MSDLNIKFKEYAEFVRSLQQQREDRTRYDLNSDDLSEDLDFLMFHGIMGVITESGELMDLVKKHLIYGRKFDKKKVADEAGDCLFYLMMIIDQCGLTIGDIIDLNVAKLKARYPDGFTKDKANNRDLEAEEKAQHRFLGKGTDTLPENVVNCNHSDSKVIYRDGKDIIYKCNSCTACWSIK